MPNTPALVQSAATAICGGRRVTDVDLELVQELFSLVGTVYQVGERQMDAVTGVSGSGPAYVFSFIEALSDAGVKNGLPRDIASGLAIQTVLGAAQLLQQSGEHPAVQRDRVSSPGGTTIAALHTLENGRLHGLVMDAVDAAVKRSKELAGIKLL
jgi:pyrroline-5-carboxylate reductase